MSAQRRIPSTTVQLGTVLDLLVQDSGYRKRIDEWAGWLMCCAENGFELAPGRCKLYLFPKVSAQDGPESGDRSAAARAYERWHKREPKWVELVDVPDAFGYCQGRVLRIGYRSDKWSTRKVAHDYDHDFSEDGGRPPLLYTTHSNLETSRGAMLVGGSMVITERGIA